MPSADPVTGTTDTPRFILDETSLDFEGFDASWIEDGLETLADTIAAVQNDGFDVYLRPNGETYAYPTTAEADFGAVLSGVACGVDRDTRLRMSWILQKCPEWDLDALAHDEVSIDGGPGLPAFSVAFALGRALLGRCTACIVFGTSRETGRHRIESGGDGASVWFVAETAQLEAFWRDAIESEDVTARAFFQIAGLAFRRVIFHDGLSLDAFEGAYRDIRADLVKGIGVLNDHLLAEHENCAGDKDRLAKVMTARGARISPESPKTHRNASAMRQREVEHDGRTWLCEWHLKLERHRNRAYFTFDRRLNGKILVGIFSRHLTT